MASLKKNIAVSNKQPSILINPYAKLHRRTKKNEGTSETAKKTRKRNVRTNCESLKQWNVHTLLLQYSVNKCKPSFKIEPFGEVFEKFMETPLSYLLIRIIQHWLNDSEAFNNTESESEDVCSTAEETILRRVVTKMMCQKTQNQVDRGDKTPFGTGACTVEVEELPTGNVDNGDGAEARSHYRNPPSILPTDEVSVYDPEDDVQDSSGDTNKILSHFSIAAPAKKGNSASNKVPQSIVPLAIATVASGSASTKEILSRAAATAQENNCTANELLAKSIAPALIATVATSNSSSKEIIPSASGGSATQNFSARAAAPAVIAAAEKNNLATNSSAPFIATVENGNSRSSSAKKLLTVASSSSSPMKELPSSATAQALASAAKKNNYPTNSAALALVAAVESGKSVTDEFPDTGVTAQALAVTAMRSRSATIDAPALVVTPNMSNSSYREVAFNGPASVLATILIDGDSGSKKLTANGTSPVSASTTRDEFTASNELSSSSVSPIAATHATSGDATAQEVINSETDPHNLAGINTSGTLIVEEEFFSDIASGPDSLSTGVKQTVKQPTYRGLSVRNNDSNHEPVAGSVNQRPQKLTRAKNILKKTESDLCQEKSRKGRPKKQDEEVCAIGKKCTKGGGKWISCDGCQKWFHGSCIDVSDRNIVRIVATKSPFYCRAAKCQKLAQK